MSASIAERVQASGAKSTADSVARLYVMSTLYGSAIPRQTPSLYGSAMNAIRRTFIERLNTSTDKLCSGLRSDMKRYGRNMTI
jgi:hypothetical protein